MNIGIIVYSQTGNTHSVALKLAKKLYGMGHSVNLERLKVLGEYKQGMKEIKFESLPDLEKYTVLIFGSHVEAFSLSGVMKSYLELIPSLKRKKVACFVTKALPFHWTGGNRAISILRKTSEKKGGTVCGTGIVIWRKKGREKRTNELVDRLGKLF